jgi:hypothetical protein
VAAMSIAVSSGVGIQSLRIVLLSISHTGWDDGFTDR